jgi:acetyltransferase-like isoleucine patch superfamily enzyme
VHEGLAASVTVVVSDACRAADLITKSGCGRVVRAGSATALEEAIFWAAGLTPHEWERTREFPWNLRAGDNHWIGEGVWIHNQGLVTIEDKAILSTGSVITTGLHDIYSTMDLRVEPVTIRRGAWITTRCIVLQGVEVGENTVVTPGSVVKKSLPAGGIYAGNPAKFVRERWKRQR